MTAPASTTPRSRTRREVYIDAFRGLMALVMVQGHVCDTVLSLAARAHPAYSFQTLFHGSTAPGFLFASGFVAGLPRSPLSLRASVRRARRLIFVLGVGYWLHLPFFSLAKTLEASASEKAALFACDALQAIAVCQLLVMGVQWAVGGRWPIVTGLLALAVLVSGPFVWASGVSASLPPAFGAYLDVQSGSHFPLFPHAAFVFAGTVAGAFLGRQDPAVRHRRGLRVGVGLLAAGLGLTPLLAPWVDFWGVSPAYVLVRLGALVLLLRGVEWAADRGAPGTFALAVLGRETLLVFVLHLLLLYGGILGRGPLSPLAGRLGFLEALLILVAILPVLFVAAWAWHRVKARSPRGGTLVLIFLGVWFAFEFATRPW